VLKKIKESIDKISLATANVLEEFSAITSAVDTVSTQETSVLQAMEEQSAGSKQILETISRLNELTQTVRNGSGQMLEGSRQVITESHSLQTATMEISNDMNEMAAGAIQINTAANSVSTMAHENKQVTEVLENEIGKFKIG
jgi:methyl-accepting chemotaxis protein